MSRKSLITGAPLTLTLLCQGTNAAAKPYLPPKGKVFTGVSGGEYPRAYNRQTGKHGPVFQTFIRWGGHVL